jgi:putative membrane protein
MGIVDLLLAIFHHLLVFSLAAILAAEWVLVRSGLSGPSLRLLARIDGAYGGIAMGVIVIGASRVYFGLRSWEFYVYSYAFWAKMAAFAIVGLLSIRPTLRILGWRRMLGETGAVADGEILAVRSWLKAEIAVFALIPIFAAAMARGIG